MQAGGPSEQDQDRILPGFESTRELSGDEFRVLELHVSPTTGARPTRSLLRELQSGGEPGGGEADPPGNASVGARPDLASSGQFSPSARRARQRQASHRPSLSPTPPYGPILGTARSSIRCLQSPAFLGVTESIGRRHPNQPRFWRRTGSGVDPCCRFEAARVGRLRYSPSMYATSPCNARSSPSASPASSTFTGVMRSIIQSMP